MTLTYTYYLAHRFQASKIFALAYDGTDDNEVDIKKQ